jgi:hypothetical protein
MTTNPSEVNPTEIACDESGNTGENVTQGSFGVFSEGSHDLSIAESERVMDWLRGELPSNVTEIKWKHVKSRRSEIVEELFQTHLASRSVFYLTGKTYFVVGKVIDLLVEEMVHEDGGNLYAGGRARKMARSLYVDGPRALGPDSWQKLLVSFNSLMRIDTATQRLKATPKATVEEFFVLVEQLRWSASRRNVQDVLAELSKSRLVAEDFVQSLNPTDRHLPALDPLIPSLAQTIRYWYEAKGRVPIRVLHDAGPLPSSAAMEFLADGLRHPGEFWQIAAPIRVDRIEAADSESDARIQIADLVAGFGAWIASLALRGELSEPFQSIAQAMVEPTSLWGDEASASVLGLDVH